MSKASPHITRKCIVCGQSKPLMAFLQQGGSYGTTCATCKTKQGSDDDGSTSKGVRVDDKARLLAEQEQKRLLEEKKELGKEALEKRELLAKEKKQKVGLIADSDTKRREDYLNIKNALLTTPSRKDETDTTKKSASDTAISVGQQQEHQTSQQKQVEQQVKEETTVDFASTIISHTKYTGPDRQKFLRWLGSSNPLTRAYEQAFGQKGSPEQSAKSTQQATPAKATAEKKSGSEWLRTFENKTSEKKESSIGERVETALGPSQRKS